MHIGDSTRNATESVWLVPSTRIDDVWPYAVPFLKKGAETLGYYEPDHIKPLIEKGEMQLWVAGNFRLKAACLTEIQRFPKATVLIIRGLGGRDMGSWLANIAVIERWGIDKGCDRARIVGRPGWERVLKDYRKRQVHLEKTLCG